MTANIKDVEGALRSAGFAVKNEQVLLSIDTSNNDGQTRSYVIEIDGGVWCITQTDTQCRNDGDYDENQVILGTFETADQIVEAITDAELEQGYPDQDEDYEE